MDPKTYGQLMTALQQNDVRKQLELHGMGNQKLPYDPGKMFGTQVTGYGGLGSPMAVSQNDPNTIRFWAGTGGAPIRDVTQAPDYYMAHEMEHVLANRGIGRYGGDFTGPAGELAKQYKAIGGADTGPLAAISWGSTRPETVARLKQLGGDDAYITNISKHPAMFGIDNWNEAPTEEILASLSGLEGAKGIDITKDPVLSKSLFGGDEKLMAAYKAVTGLRQERLDAKDLPPYTAQKPAEPPSMVDQISNFLQNYFSKGK